MAYESIRQWHNASEEYYIENLIEQAKATNAPANATFRKEDGSWSTADDIVDIENRPDMAQFVQCLTKEEA